MPLRAHLLTALCLLAPAPTLAQQVTVRLVVAHVEADPVTGEPCGGEFAGGRNALNVFFDNIEMNARDEQVSWPERNFDTLAPGEGGVVEVNLAWSPGNPVLGVPAGLQSLYTVRVGWDDRDVLATDRAQVADPYRIEQPGTLWVTRDGWTSRDPGRDYARIGVPVCNRPPAAIETTALFEDRDPGSVFIGWSHDGGLAQAVDWELAEVYLGPEPRIDPAWRVYTQVPWGFTNTTVRGLDCGRWHVCYRNFDQYGHTTETCDDAIDVMNCLMEPDMAVPDMAVPDMAVPDMAVPDMALLDMAEPDMALPDMAELDLAPPVDQALPDPQVDGGAEPDQALPDPQVDGGAFDGAPGDQGPPLDQALPDPQVDGAVLLDAAPGDLAVTDQALPDPQVDGAVLVDAAPGDGGFDGGETFDATPTGTQGGGTADSGCRSTPGPAAWLLVLALVALRRRRASHAA